MNFVVNICGCETKWTAENIIEDAVVRIKEQVGDDEVILGLSGGVDSSVVALLLHRAIGKNLHCVFVDNGLLRLHEGDQVMEMFGDKFGLNITRVDAESRFLGELAGVRDPEAKRKIIGKVFVDVFVLYSTLLHHAPESFSVIVGGAAHIMKIRSQHQGRRFVGLLFLHVRFLCVSSCPVGSAALSLLSAILRQPFLALLFQTSQTLFFRLFRFIKLFS